MKKVLFFMLAAMFVPVVGDAAALTGLYQTIDDKTNQPKSIVALYEYTDDDDVALAGVLLRYMARMARLRKQLQIR